MTRKKGTDLLYSLIAEARTYDDTIVLGRGDPDFDTLLVRDESGTEHSLTAAEARGALLAQMGTRIVLVLPGRGRSQWISGVVELVSEE